MKNLHEGLDYLLYRIYIFGGFAALVICSVLVALFLEIPKMFDDPERAVLPIIAAPLTLWILGALAYWWWVFLFKGNKELKETIRNRPDSTPEISALKSWGTLHTAMAIYGGSADEMLAAERSARWPVLIWYGLQNLLVLWILGNFWVWMSFQDTLPANYIMRVWVPGVLVIVGLFVVTPFLVSRAIKGGEDAYLGPLGLSMAESPSDIAYPPGLLSNGQAAPREGATVFNGSRRGRPVYVETVGKCCYTWVQAETPRFEIHSQDGKLVAGRDTPQAVTQALKGLRKAKRWRGIQVTGGLDGIGIERDSPGQNMWLYDLWLIERLLEGLIEKRA